MVSISLLVGCVPMALCMGILWTADSWMKAVAHWDTRAHLHARSCANSGRRPRITGADGHELSDRWQEALEMRDMIRALWQRIEQEHGRSRPAVPRTMKPAAIHPAAE
jgi:hypothetical protein